jgi:hypothetical protein
MDKHPLMPGIRSAEAHHRDWPRTLHDKQLTGFSPLELGMSQAPTVWRQLELAGDYQWIEAVTSPSAGFLVADGRLSLYEAAGGQRRWRTQASGSLAFWGDLYGDGGVVALLRQGNRLTVVDGTTGDVRWSQSYEPAHVDLRVQVASVLAGRGGQQVAVFEQYGGWGWLLAFTPDGDVREVWRREVITDDVWPVRADHGCDIAFDLTAERPLLWNVRHHRCQSFDAVTGEPLGVLQYDLDGAFRRNYGPWRIATGAHGQRAIVVASEMVQTHVHGLRLHGDGRPELAWQRYYGEVYVVPGVAVEFLGVGDVDGDGADEVCYNVRDPAFGFRSFVRARDVASGQIKHELADRWCSAWVPGVGRQRRTLLLTHPAPEGATPEQGPLQVMGFESAGLRPLAAFDHGGPWGIAAPPGADGADLWLRLVEGSEAALVRLDGTTLQEIDRAESGALLSAPTAACVRVEGTVYAANREGMHRWPDGDTIPVDLRGGAPPTLSAARLHDHDRATLVAHVPGRRLQTWQLHGSGPEQVLDEPFLGETARHSPLLYDLDGDGDLELLVPGATPQGELSVRALRGDGAELWHVVLPEARTDDDGKAVAWNAGDFLKHDAGPRAAVAVTVYSKRRTQEGTYLLDGLSGEVHWFLGTYHDGDVIRAYRPVGIPGVFDWDGDGVEEIAWDMYSYMAFLRGDGDMAAIFGGSNVRPEDEAVSAISLYNGFTPVYRTETDESPHWLVHHGHGRFGLVGPDPRQGIWHEDEGYDTPERIGFVDVDDDGVLEVGYALRNSNLFRCRDLWTGDDKWNLELPSPPRGPVLTADVDGDGKGEFLVDRWCIGTDADGRGQIRWTSPVSLGWAVIADFDGDGRGEIACSSQGLIAVLKA